MKPTSSTKFHDDEHSRLLTAPELASYLGVSLSTVRRLTRDSQVPVVRVREAVRYDREAVVTALSNEL